MLRGGTEWREARTCAGTPNYLIASIRDNKVTLKSDTANTAYLTLEDAYFPDVYVDGYRTDFSITVKNHNSELCGRIYIYVVPEEEGESAVRWQIQGVSMMAGETVTYDFSQTNFWVNKEGKYHVRIFYEANLFADELIEFEYPEDIIMEVIKANKIEIASAERQGKE